MLQVTKGKRNFEKDAEYFEIPVDLSSGNVLDEKRDRLPSLQFVIRPTEIAVNGVVGDPAAKAVDCLDPDAGKMVASAELLKRAISRERPSYPAAARAVRATGQVTVAIRVASDGTTECAIAISGHPLLRATVTNAVKNWKFETSETGYFGFLTFEGSWALVAPDGTVIKDMP